METQKSNTVVGKIKLDVSEAKAQLDELEAQIDRILAKKKEAGADTTADVKNDNKRDYKADWLESQLRKIVREEFQKISAALVEETVKTTFNTLRYGINQSYKSITETDGCDDSV